MTIERQWIEVMKNEVPEAFSGTCPFVPEAAFIDAQIKLMAMPSETPTWAGFLHKQFVTPVRQMFALGATTVVLAFDDYAFVPRAKAITQAKRRERLTPIEFIEGQQLPPIPPTPWPAAMANRAFKARVVQLIIESIPQLLSNGSAPRVDSRLIVDYKETNQWTWADNGTFTMTPWAHVEV
jgi:hypothetical protein